jgi:hypothetical protein
MVEVEFICEISKSPPFRNFAKGWGTPPQRTKQFFGVDAMEWYYPAVGIIQFTDEKGWATRL